MKISLRDEKAVLELIELCTLLEAKAASIYETLRDRAEDERMRSLWSTMAVDEHEHRRYWLRLKDICAEGAVPEVFDDPKRFVDEVRALTKRVDHLSETVKRDYRAPAVFIHVLRLEFLLLHPSFMMLFHYLPESPLEVSPSRTYERHLGRLLNLLMDYQELTPELELLGEAIGQLWKKSEEGTTRAILDPLTGTYNRRGLYIAMKPLIYLARRERQRAGVMILEVSNLKGINAEHGHKVGDEILQLASRAICSRLRASDVVGRFGGDDFLALLTRFDERYFERIGYDLIGQVHALAVDAVKPALTIGAASTVVGEDAQGHLESLIREADGALLAARAAGRDCLVRQL